jgi:hypothetical protein
MRNPALPRLALAVALASLSAAACENQPNLAGIEVRIVDAAGRNPVAAMDGAITVRVRHAGSVIDCADGACEAEVRDGTYELSLPIASFDGRTALQVELSGEGDARWIGASPAFVPFGEGVDVVGGVYVVVGRPDRCETLSLNGVVTESPPRLAPARARAAAVRRRNLVLLAGGEDFAGDPDDHVERLDQLLFDVDPLGTWERPFEIGPARGVALSEDVSLVVGSRALRFVLDSFGPPLGEELELAGASVGSALVSLGASGAAVVGGPGSSTIHWIGIDGALRGSTSLTTVRSVPAAARMSGGVLVVGGQETGALAEWVRALEPAEALELAGTPLPLGARGGELLPSPDGRDALWIGFTVDGVPSADTFVFRGCPGACVVEPGPRWAAPRNDYAPAVTDAGALWLVGGRSAEAISALTDVVTWRSGAPLLTPGPVLVEPRADATAVEHASGVVLVMGGRTDAALLDTVEACFPSELDSLD